jgi:NADH:ubiquinone oxidoreductase subunit E
MRRRSMDARDNGAVDLSLMDGIFAEHKGQQGTLIPILQAAQTAYGYLPPEVLNLIATRLDVSLSKVYGVATFYTQFYHERRGKHVFRLCDGTACHVKGTPALAGVLEKEYGISLGETTVDYALTTELVYCLGSCALAPVGVLDDQVMGHLQRDTMLEQVKRRVDDTRKPPDVGGGEG